MGLMAKNCALTVFKVENPAAVTAEKLKQFAFTPIDDLPNEETARGWVNFDDILDLAWEVSVPEKGNFMVFGFRIDTRRVPAPVLKVEYEKALQEEMEKAQAEGKKFVSRERKKELKALIKAKLMAKTPPSPAVVDAALDMTTGQLLVGSTSGRQLEAFAEHFKSSFGQDMKELTFAGLEDRADALKDGLAMESFLQEIYGHSQDVSWDGHTFNIAEAGEVTLQKESGETVSSRNEPGSVAAGLEAGLYIRKMKLTLTDESSMEWNAVIDQDFRFRLQTPSVEKSKDADPDAVLLEKLYLIQLAVGALHELFRSRWG